MNRDIQRIASQLNIPFCRSANFIVPYITPTQRSHVSHLINAMVRNTTLTSWERKAARAHMRIVSSAPLNVRRAFQRHTNKHTKSQTCPPCACTQANLPIWQQGGTIYQVQGHYTQLPLELMHGNVKVQATDPLPCSGLKSCQQAIESLTRLATTLKVQTRFSKHMLSKSLP